jgi:hypothetical protein
VGGNIVSPHEPPFLFAVHGPGSTGLPAG